MESAEDAATLFKGRLRAFIEKGIGEDREGFMSQLKKNDPKFITSLFSEWLETLSIS